MIECPACKHQNPDAYEACECGYSFYRRSTGKMLALACGLGILGVLAGWYGGTLWACGDLPGGRGGGHSMCGLVVFTTVPLGGLAGAILGGILGWSWRTRTARS